jgi:hypothetical protein
MYEVVKMIHGTVDGDKGISAIHFAGRILCLSLVLGVIGCAPKLMGPTVPSHYQFAVFTPYSVIVGVSDTIIVRLQDAQGQKVSGVTVRFQVAPSWANQASVMPAEVIAQEGQAQVIFQGNTTGNVPVRVQVENITHEINIDVNERPSPPSGA